MAMVFLSERMKPLNSISNKENNIINKVEEEKINESKKIIYNYNRLKKNRIKSLSETNIKGKYNDTPGPGTYNIPNIYTNTHNNKNISFLTNSPRFLNPNSETEFFPGPGSYNLSDNNNKLILKKPIYKIINNYNKLYNSSFESSNNINNNPIKLHNDLIEDEKGKLIQINNTDTNSKKSKTNEKNAKNNLIQPETNKFYMKNKNPMVEWNKMSARNLTPNNDRRKVLENIIEDLKMNTYISSKNPDNSKSKIMDILNYRSKVIPKQIKLLSDIHKENNNNNNTLKEEETFILNEKINKNNNKKNINKIKGKLYPINYPYNKDNKEKLTYENTINNKDLKEREVNSVRRLVSPSPGSYFNFNDNYKKLLLKRKSIKNRNSKNTNKNIIEHKKKTISYSILGPGSYNLIRKRFDKKSFNSVGNFSKEKRFNENTTNNDFNKNNNITPGPGQYNNEYKWKKYFKKVLLYKKFVNSENEFKKSMNKRLKNLSGDFNKYQSFSMINIIQSKINKNINQYTSKKSPFLSGECRFSYTKDIEKKKNLGPGMYDIQSNFSHKNFGKNVPFNSHQPRELNFMNNNLSLSNLSPCSYDLNNSFKWNKKSFNIMYI